MLMRCVCLLGKQECVPSESSRHVMSTDFLLGGYSLRICIGSTFSFRDWSVCSSSPRVTVTLVVIILWTIVFFNTFLSYFNILIIMSSFILHFPLHGPRPRLQAMARSIGDHAVKGAGVVATPEVKSVLRGRNILDVLTPLNSIRFSILHSV